MGEVLKLWWTIELWVNYLIMGELLTYGWNVEIIVDYGINGELLISQEKFWILGEILNHVWTFKSCVHF